jgi:uncharacterized protein (DUF58 family)
VSDYGPLLEEVRRLRWRAGRPVTGALPGAHPSRRRGTSAEFAEYRPYRQGDPLARVDWKLFARTDRAYLRLSPDRTVLPTMVVVDASESMDFPAAARSKLNRARQLSVALAAVAHQEGDPVGVAVAGRVTAVFRPRTRGGVVGEIAALLDQVVPASGGSLTEALGAATRVAQRVVLVGDLLSGDEQLIALLRSHVLRGGEGYVAQIVALEELDPVPGAVHDPERPDEMRVLDEAGTDAYRLAFARWRDDVAARCRAAGVPCVLSRTDEPAGPQVRRILAAGSGLAAR